MNSLPNDRAPTVGDDLSLYIPVVVGLATIASNVLKVLFDIVQIANDRLHPVPADIKAMQETLKSKAANPISFYDGYIDDSRKLSELNKVVEPQEKRLTDLQKHIKFIGIGIIRTIPIAGQVYSYKVSNDYNARLYEKWNSVPFVL